MFSRTRYPVTCLLPKTLRTAKSVSLVQKTHQLGIHSTSSIQLVSHFFTFNPGFRRKLLNSRLNCGQVFVRSSTGSSRCSIQLANHFRFHTPELSCRSRLSLSTFILFVSILPYSLPVRLGHYQQFPQGILRHSVEHYTERDPESRGTAENHTPRFELQLRNPDFGTAGIRRRRRCRRADQRPMSVLTVRLSRQECLIHLFAFNVILHRLDCELFEPGEPTN